MTITPTSSVFTALSLADIARPVPRTAARPVERTDGETEQRAGTQNTAFRQAVSKTADENSATPPRQQQMADDFRREAVTPRPTFQKLGQLVDLSI